MTHSPLEYSAAVASRSLPETLGELAHDDAAVVDDHGEFRVIAPRVGEVVVPRRGLGAFEAHLGRRRADEREDVLRRHSWIDVTEVVVGQYLRGSEYLARGREVHAAGRGPGGAGRVETGLAPPGE